VRPIHGRLANPSYGSPQLSHNEWKRLGVTAPKRHSFQLQMSDSNGESDLSSDDVKDLAGIPRDAKNLAGVTALDAVGNPMDFGKSHTALNLFGRNKSMDSFASFGDKAAISKRQVLLKVLSRAAISLSLLTLATTAAAPSALAAAAPSALAKKAAEIEHLHVGQKLANYFRTFGIPDLGILALISAMPVIELRGAVPVGLWMGLPLTKVLPTCVLGNMVPIIPLLYILRNERLKKAMKPILDRAERKSSSLGVGSLEKQWASLAAFVGIPLPGTGAWTGAMAAFLLGMPTLLAISSIFTGVVSAGGIMAAITLSGKKGGLAALAILAIITGQEFLKGSGKEEPDADADAGAK